ncbi:MAG: fimbrillin family protein [Duncaniella sp.]|nr:fimbrillin family protein [Duncaniella sp.]
MNTKVSSLGLAVMLLATACSEDSVEMVNYGPEITFNTNVSRAQNISEKNLNSFNVWAFSDITESAAFIDGLTATKVNGKEYFAFDHSIFWPSDVQTLNFWAVSGAKKESISKNNKKLSISNFTPDIDPLKQQDLIVAYTSANRLSGTSVSLSFHHALSQIVVRATEGIEGDESKSITIKGAWIVNPAASGNLSSDNGVNLVWNPSSTKATYGMQYAEAKKLDHTSTSLFDFDPSKEDITKAQSNLLLVPQQLTGWTGDEDSDNKLKGAYILLLCRVEATHDGAYHEGETTDPSIKSDEENDKHTHQMFPYTGNFDPNEYGYSCVPVDTKWEPGKRYIYNLSFCGATSGAGIYPPTDHPTVEPENPDDKYIENPPIGKEPGDPVLDNPITFTVTVVDWEDEKNADGSGWTNGNINMN